MVMLDANAPPILRPGPLPPLNTTVLVTLKPARTLKVVALVVPAVI